MTAVSFNRSASKRGVGEQANAKRTYVFSDGLFPSGLAFAQQGGWLLMEILDD
jgi:hypothetical protein